ncbi:ATP-binding cassette domain-containing protein [soil metagenome]
MIAGDAKSHTLKPSLIIAGGITVGGLVLPLDTSLQYTLVASLAWAVAAVGLDLLVGYAGQVSFGQAAFVALGAYSVTALRVNLGFPLIPAIILGIIIVAGIALFLGSIVLRLRIFGLAVSTLFFGYVVVTVLMGDGLSTVFGGANGLLAPAFDLIGTNPKSLMALSGIVLIIVVIITANITESQTGRALRMIKKDEAVASAAGIRVKQVKLFAFVYCCVLGAVAGVLYSAVVGYLGPDGFAIDQSISIFAMMVVGGAGTIGGPILGAVLITVVPGYFLRDGHVSAIVFAAILLVFLILLPEGLYGLGQRAYAVVLRWLRPVLPKRKPKPIVAADAEGEADLRGGTSRLSTATAVDRAKDASLAGPSLEIDDVRVQFGDFVALDEVSITVKRGSVHAIIGPNGAGKTTLLNAVSGLYIPVKGDIRLEGESTKGLLPHQIRKRGVIRTFQTPAIVPDLDVLENVKLGLDADERSSFWIDLVGPLVTRKRERALEAEAHWALDAVGIPRERRSLMVKGLDLSEQKRVELARGLVGHAKILLLDEPTAGLSVAEMDALAAVLKDVHERFQLTIMVISHHIGFILDIADEMTVLDYGRVIGNGEPAEVLARPVIAQTFMGVEAEPDALTHEEH